VEGATMERDSSELTSTLDGRVETPALRNGNRSIEPERSVTAIDVATQIWKNASRTTEKWPTQMRKCPNVSVWIALRDVR